MTSEQDLIRIIAENATTVNQEATGFFNEEDYVESDFILRPEIPLRGNSIVIYNDVKSVMRLHKPIGLNEER